MDVEMDEVDNCPPKDKKSKKSAEAADTENPLGSKNGNLSFEDTTDILIPPVASSLGTNLSNPNGNETNDSKSIWDLFKPKSSKTQQEEDNGPFASCKPMDFVYNMSHKKRGRAIIFNHTRFDQQQSLSDRPGTEHDANALSFAFTNLQFEVEFHNNYTFKKIDGILEKVSLDDHKDEDCIAVVVMSHGRLNKLHAFDHEYNPDVLWNKFTGDKCPGLAGKPKLFFIQACRGDQYDDGTLLAPRNGRTVVDGPGDVKPYRIPNQADFLMVFSTVEALPENHCNSNISLVSRLFNYLSLSNSGHYSWRNSRKGSCFIQALCRVFNNCASQLDVLSMITMVNCEVAINYESNVPRDVTQHQKKQVPHVSHTLTRQIHLTQKGTLV